MVTYCITIKPVAEEKQKEWNCGKELTEARKIVISISKRY